MSEDKPMRKPKHSPPINAVYMNFSLLSANREDDSERRRKEELRAKYPDVPLEQREVWERSDLELPKSADWNEALSTTYKFTQKAAALCEDLMHKASPTTPKALRNYANTLIAAVHKLQSLACELHLHYPSAPKEFYIPQVQPPEISAPHPEILIQNENRILIYMPCFPPRRDQRSNLFTDQLKYLLATVNLPSLGKWHCDFIHVYPHNSKRGYDVDNYYYKPIIDYLAAAMGTYDCTDWFSCSMYNHYTDNINNGFYIIISKRMEKVPFFRDFEELVSGAEIQ